MNDEGDDTSVEITVLEWNPADRRGMEQDLEICLTAPTTQALLNEFNRQYGGGMVTSDQDGSIQIDSTTSYAAWLYQIPAGATWTYGI